MQANFAEKTNGSFGPPRRLGALSCLPGSYLASIVESILLDNIAISNPFL